MTLCAQDYDLIDIVWPAGDVLVTRGLSGDGLLSSGAQVRFDGGWRQENGLPSLGALEAFRH